MIRRAGQEFLGSLLPDRCELIIFCQLSDYQRTLYSALSKSCKYNDVSGDVLGIVMQLRLLCNHPALVDVHDTAVQVDIELSGKMSVLRDLLRNIRTRCPSDKIVIVSNFTSVLSFIERYILDVNGWSHLRLDGQTDVHKRQNIVDSFNRGDAESSFAFLLSAKAGGCGLNLTGGNAVINNAFAVNRAIHHALY
jgi:SNF2 family DNA or RNA helicase